ncbi:hypothetical protein PLICRDRAFT_107235 [Plicaturopsis crispa FD-325 SS-3]|nr:hypothetical protein PLICRDRAFT_107235 [Plicaturopsis crispa FD-325 SS-3]
MAPIRVGTIGLSTTGWASTHHAPALPEPYKLVALSTTRAETADEASKKFGVKGYHGDPAQIAQDKDVDLVVVSVKLPHHKASVWPAIEAGKDVFVEWPLGRDLAEAKEIEQFAREKGVRTIVGLQARQGNAVRKAKELINSGKIGKVLSTSVVKIRLCTRWKTRLVPSSFEEGRVLTSLDPGANVLSIPTSHTLDAFAYVLGEFASLSATTVVAHTKVGVIGTDRTIESTATDHVVIQGILQTGAIASVHFRGGGGADVTIPTYKNKGSVDFFWEIEGEDGIIVLRGPTGHIQVGAFVLQIIEPELYLNGEKVDVGEIDPLGPTRREYAEFAKGPGGEYLDFAHAVKRHEVIDAIERSAREGKRVSYL